MDEPSNNSNLPKILPIGLIAIIIIAAIIVYNNQNQSKNNVGALSSQFQNSSNSVSNVNPSVTGVQSDTPSSYTDGTYQAIGDYITPGGPREINVGITITNGVVTGTTFESLAEDRESKRFQTEFGDNFQPLVVGKNINELNLTKVSGSSLTPIGFNDALQKIKQQASV